MLAYILVAWKQSWNEAWQLWESCWMLGAHLDVSLKARQPPEVRVVWQHP